MWLPWPDRPSSQARVRLAEQFRHQLNGRSLEDKREGQSLSKVCLDTSQKLRGQQRMAAKFKKILRDVQVFIRQHILPYSQQASFGKVARCGGPWRRKLIRVSACEQGLAV